MRWSGFDEKIDEGDVLMLIVIRLELGYLNIRNPYKTMRLIMFLARRQKGDGIKWHLS